MMQNPPNSGLNSLQQGAGSSGLGQQQIGPPQGMGRQKFVKEIHIQMAPIFI
jgi:hypothetical protein